MNTHALNELSSSILKLHKALLDFQKKKTERETGKTMNPYEALNAALNSPDFSWLKPLSQMAVEIDLASESLKDVSKNLLETANSPVFDADKIKNFWKNPPQDLQDKIIEALSENPDISFLFSEVKLKASHI